MHKPTRRNVSIVYFNCFKKLLRYHGYAISKCKVNRTEIKTEASALDKLNSLKYGMHMQH